MLPRGISYFPVGLADVPEVVQQPLQQVTPKILTPNLTLPTPNPKTQNLNPKLQNGLRAQTG